MSKSSSIASLGVVIVTYNSADVILVCLDSLLAAKDVQMHIVIVDNASTDGTVQNIREWAEGSLAPNFPADLPFSLRHTPKPIFLKSLTDTGAGITLIEAGFNGGFAGGVNQGLAHLARIQGIDRFWILNPDCVVPPETPTVLANFPEPESGFSLLGGRVKYLDPPNLIQSDGGKINWITGVTENVNSGLHAADAPLPNVAEMDFICGASMVASRAFYEISGPLPEEYFLYYEEVSWALRRGTLPLIYCPDALIYHHAGSAIGSPKIDKMASDFSVYYKFRSRMLFIRTHSPLALPFTYVYALGKGAKFLLQGYRTKACALFRAIHGFGPPKT